jgi:predicted DNA-binding ribbon-helix-helix protein
MPSISHGRSCVIFATLQNSFYAATVRDKFSISMSRVYYSHCLEDAFWNALKEIAKARNVTLSDLVAAIDSERQHDNLSSTIRLFVLEVYRKQLFDLKEGRITESIFWAAA